MDLRCYFQLPIIRVLGNYLSMWVFTWFLWVPRLLKEIYLLLLRHFPLIIIEVGLVGLGSLYGIFSERKCHHALIFHPLSNLAYEVILNCVKLNEVILNSLFLDLLLSFADSELEITSKVSRGSYTYFWSKRSDKQTTL